MTGTSRLLTLTATAVIALGAAAGPSLAAQESGKGQAYGQKLMKQLKQAQRGEARSKAAKRAKQGDRVKHSQQAGLVKPPVRVKPPKADMRPVFVKPPKHGKSPVRVKPPKADVRPVFVKPPQHDRSPVRTNPPKADVRPVFVKPPKHDRSPVRVKPPKADVMPVFVRPPVPVKKAPHHAPPRYPKHVGSTPYRPMVPPERHYHNHNQRVVVHNHYNTGHRHYHHDDHGSYLLPFLAFGVTAAILTSQSHYGAAPAYPAYQEEVTFTTPRAPVGQPAVQPAPIEMAGPPASCVMTREYQTQISVGGQLVQGYGQACLQPDGSWYHGPAVPEPY